MSIASRYRKQYYQYLRYQHRDFDVKGLSTLATYALELNQVFVELNIDPTTFIQMSANPIQVPRTLQEGSHAIWDYLVSAPLAKQHLVIIGPPGSGKTTLLKHITLTLVSHRKHSHHNYRGKIPHKLPILLFLRDHVNSIKDMPDFSLVEALNDHLRKWEQPEPPAGWIKRRLMSGRCLIMLDGLDEVAELETRQKVVDWVQKQMAAFNQNRFLITSRPFGYRSNPLSNVATLEVRPFSYEQVERFVHQWYLANEIMSKQKDDPGVRMRARADAKKLLQELRNAPALFDLTVNPLLLTMIATVHRYGGELPSNRVALYAEICEVFLGKRQKARGQILELTPDQMQLVLQPLAYHLMCEGIRDIAPSEAQAVIEEPLAQVNSQMLPQAFLRLVENTSGLLLERENGIYSFAHLTFQEYLAASHLREKQLGDKLIAHVGESWWQETIRLYCAMADATPIIAACLADDHPSLSALTLALDYEKEARQVDPKVKTRLETILQQGVEDPDLERQHVVAEALLAQRLQQMIYLKERIYVDTSFVTCAEYQVFLDEQRAYGKYYQPDHWTSYHFPPGEGNRPVLGVRPSDAATFCTWLTEREQGPWVYRLPRDDDELDGTEAENMLSRLKPGSGFWLDQGQRFIWAKGIPLTPKDTSQENTHPISMLVLILLLDRTYERARAIAYALDCAPTSGLYQARDRVGTLASARARDLISIYALNLDSVRDDDLVQDRALNHNSVRDDDRAHNRVLILTHVLRSIPHLNHYNNLVRDLDLELINAIDRALDLQRETTPRGKEIQQSSHQQNATQRTEHVTPGSTNSYIDMYTSLIVLHERIKGKLPAFEGILLMKEQKQENVKELRGRI
jgi:energy-coupling factor transporter ATP-binding protein EcfA2